MHNACVDTPGERLRAAREAAGFETAADAARKMRVKYPTYAGHENQHRGQVGRFAGNIDLYADTFQVRAEWLRTGYGPMKREKKTLIQEIFDELPETRQKELVDFALYLKSKAA